MFDGVQEHEVPQRVAFDREQEGVAAALQALEQVGAAETHQAPAGARQVVQHPGFGRRRRRAGRRRHVVAETVARKLQAVDGVDHVVGEQPGVLRVDGEAQRAGRPRREVRARAVLEGQVAAAVGRVRGGVVFLHEAARAADEEQAHQVAPVVGVLRLLEGGQRPHRRLVAAHELRLAHLPQQAFGADADVGALGHEQAQLARQVQVRLVVGGRRQQDALAVVLPDVLLNRAVAPAPAVPQVVALVDQHQAVAAQVGQFLKHPAHRQDAGAHPVPLPVVLPHGDEVPGAEDQRLQPVVVLEHPRQRGGHEGLAQADDVADDHAAPPVQVVRGDLHGGGLEVEEPGAEVPGDAEPGQPGPRLLRQVVRHLDVDVMRRNRFLPRPAPPDDRGQLVRHVDAPAVVPALLEPRRELFARVVVEHVDVELALTGQPGLREVAAAQIPHRRIGRVRPEQQVKLGVQGMAEKQLHHDLPRP